MADLVLNSLKKGINFLISKQKDSGEFSTDRWLRIYDTPISLPSRESVFVSSFILHSLKFVNEIINVHKIFKSEIIDFNNSTKNAIIFLHRRKEEFGLWRFYEKKYGIPMDIDCTCCVLAVLKEWNFRELDYDSIAGKLLLYRNSEKIFRTWINGDKVISIENNDVDWVVNANALFFYSLLNQQLPELEEYLLKKIQDNCYKESTKYYPDLSGIYCITRCFADGFNNVLKPAIKIIKNYLKERKYEILNDDLSCALLILSLQNCNESKDVLKLLKDLLLRQKPDGGWERGAFFHMQGRKYPEVHINYGSRELTTAFVLEAISKSLCIFDNLFA